MKNASYFFAVILLFIGINGFSQINSFKLSDYKLPDLNRKSLDTRFNLSGYHDQSNYSNDLSDYESNSKQSSLGGNLNLYYNHYINNTKYQRNTTISGYFTSNYSSRDYDTISVDRYQNVTPNINFNSINRRYFNHNLFVEIDFDAAYRYNSYKHKSENYNEIEENYAYKTHDLVTNIPIKIGLGRIERVEDARHAIYILDELSKANRIKGNQSDEEIIEFAQFISKLKNERFFDTRLQRMAEIEAIDSFLIIKGYVDKSDARYFTTLNDFWLYGKQNRESGTRISMGINPGYYLYNHNIEDNLTTQKSAYGINFEGGIEFNYEKPINLKWQHSLAARGYIGVLNGHVKDTASSFDYDISIPKLALSFSEYFNYYPNTRTSIWLGYALNYSHLFNNADSTQNIYGIVGNQLKASIYAGLDYYISPKLRLNVSSSLSYNWANTPYSDFNSNSGSSIYNLKYLTSTDPGNSPYDYLNKSLHTSFNITLSYSIF